MLDEIAALKARIEQLEQADGSLVTPRAQAEKGKGGCENDAVTTGIESLTWTWATWDNGPVFYTNLVIKFYRTGDWETSCNVADRSEHSDWDVHFRIFTQSGVTKATVFYVMPVNEDVWFQDLDHGENYNKSASGFHPQVRDYWADFAAGTFYPMGESYRVRDN